MRKYEHRYKAYYEDGKDYNSPFYRAIRKYGWDSLKYEVLNTAYSDTIEDLTSKLDSLEIYYIGQYDSYKNPRSKQVYQYTLDYELVRIWESALQAERELGYSSTSISRVCNHKQAFHGKKGEDKYIWSFTPIEKKD